MCNKGNACLSIYYFDSCHIHLKCVDLKMGSHQKLMN